MTEQNAPRLARDRLGVALVAILWVQYLVGLALELQSFAWFLITLASTLLVTIAFLVWWFTRRRFSWSQRLTVPAVMILTGVLVGRLSLHSIRPVVYVVLMGLPLVLTVWAVWLALTPRRSAPLRVAGLFALIVAGWCSLLSVRTEGAQGNMRADLHWRWTPTSEQLYLASHAAARSATSGPTTQPLALRPGDWPSFRGPAGDAVARGQAIYLDWKSAPPRVLWKQRVGPAWSSMTVIGNKLFTQEQRGKNEAVVCRDADTGSEIWSHEDAGRFDEEMSGSGPRATPAFDAGRLYTQGATGVLNCFDAATGAVIWSRDVKADAGAAAPMWGFCNSPLISDGRLIVFAGGEGKKGLLAYPLDGGAPLWTADAGKVSYASPQAITVGGDHQILIFTNEGVFAVDAATGQAGWTFPVDKAVGVPPVLQACEVAPGAFVLGHGAGFGTARIQVAPDGRSATRTWVTRAFKPSFSDMVFHDGFLYGFDGTVFCCVDANTGVRRWREGRYGAGQVVLMADQGVMIVTTEDGQAILLRCNSDRNEELGRLPVLTGNAWNHPAIAGGRLFLRSDAELACVALH